MFTADTQEFVPAASGQLEGADTSSLAAKSATATNDAKGTEYRYSASYFNKRNIPNSLHADNVETKEETSFAEVSSGDELPAVELESNTPSTSMQIEAVRNAQKASVAEPNKIDSGDKSANVASAVPVENMAVENDAANSEQGVNQKRFGFNPLAAVFVPRALEQEIVSSEGLPSAAAVPTLAAEMNPVHDGLIGNMPTYVPNPRRPQAQMMQRNFSGGYAMDYPAPFYSMHGEYSYAGDFSQMTVPMDNAFYSGGVGDYAMNGQAMVPNPMSGSFRGQTKTRVNAGNRKGPLAGNRNGRRTQSRGSDASGSVHAAEGSNNRRVPAHGAPVAESEASSAPVDLASGAWPNLASTTNVSNVNSNNSKADSSNGSQPSFSSIAKSNDKSEYNKVNKSEYTKHMKSESTKHVKSESTKHPKSETKPVKSESSKPVKSESSKPVKSESSKPVKSESSKPVKSESSKPVKSESSKPVKSESSKPVKSESSKPVKSESSKPVKSESSKPVKSESSKPVRCESSKPVRCESSKPVKSEVTKPLKSEASKPVRPDSRSSKLEATKITQSTENKSAFKKVDLGESVEKEIRARRNSSANSACVKIESEQMPRTEVAESRSVKSEKSTVEEVQTQGAAVDGDMEAVPVLSKAAKKRNRKAKAKASEKVQEPVPVLNFALAAGGSKKDKAVANKENVEKPVAKAEVTGSKMEEDEKMLPTETKSKVLMDDAPMEPEGAGNSDVEAGEQSSEEKVGSSKDATEGEGPVANGVSEDDDGWTHCTSKAKAKKIEFKKKKETEKIRETKQKQYRSNRADGQRSDFQFRNGNRDNRESRPGNASAPSLRGPLNGSSNLNKAKHPNAQNKLYPRTGPVSAQAPSKAPVEAPVVVQKAVDTAASAVAADTSQAAPEPAKPAQNGWAGIVASKKSTAAKN